MKPTIRTTLAAVGAAAAIAAVAGCSSNPTATAPTGADLKGTWTQSGTGYENGVPVTWEGQTVVIEQAQGQGFTGFKEYTPEGGQPQKEVVNGVIGVDGAVLIVDEDGRFEGRLTDGKLQGQYAETSAEDATAMNVEMTRN